MTQRHKEHREALIEQDICPECGGGLILVLNAPDVATMPGRNLKRFRLSQKMSPRYAKNYRSSPCVPLGFR